MFSKFTKNACMYMYYQLIIVSTIQLVMFFVLIGNSKTKVYSISTHLPRRELKMWSPKEKPFLNWACCCGVAWRRDFELNDDGNQQKKQKV